MSDLVSGLPLRKLFHNRYNRLTSKASQLPNLKQRREEIYKCCGFMRDRIRQSTGNKIHNSANSTQKVYRILIELKNLDDSHWSFSSLSAHCFLVGVVRQKARGQA
jgi:hypothetical protein